jgi:methyl-accepting chemotaxis protein
MREQGRTSYEMSVAVGSISKEALRITNSNRDHLEAAERIRSSVNELRGIATRNADGVKATLTSTSGLAKRAHELGEIMDSMVRGNVAANGNATGKTKAAKPKRTRKTPAENNSES